MLVSQKIALAAHLHVLLRRKTGRVTDTEWMATNAEYAREIIKFSRAKALEDGHPDLADWADKLERAMDEPEAAPRVPLAQSAVQLLRERGQAVTPAVRPARDPADSSGFGASRLPGDSGFTDSILDAAGKPRDPKAPRYVGGIR